MTSVRALQKRSGGNDRRGGSAPRGSKDLVAPSLIHFVWTEKREMGDRESGGDGIGLARQLIERRVLRMHFPRCPKSAPQSLPLLLFCEIGVSSAPWGFLSVHSVTGIYIPPPPLLPHPHHRKHQRRFNHTSTLAQLASYPRCLRPPPSAVKYDRRGEGQSKTSSRTSQSALLSSCPHASQQTHIITLMSRIDVHAHVVPPGKSGLCSPNQHSDVVSPFPISLS